MDVFKIVGKIALQGKEAFDNDVKDASSGGAKLASVVGKGLATAAKVGVAALAAASTAVVAVGKASLDAYANYEQLVGGVDTLFKDSSGLLQSYAQDAYKTAGMSANEYMETATSFSASLLQGLSGDTQKAVEYADMAIRDMSDNANKMGTDIGRIQDAYQGFAKQNYTMLDNLKLGYGGTKTEMERLLKDANRINKEHGKLTNYSIDNLSDVYEAIHVVQEEMGIYGTTAEEASKTISGSLNATKAAWQNLLVGFADGNQELDVLIGNFVDSVTTAARNIVPRLAQILGGISEAMAAIIPVITAELPGLLSELLPGVLQGAGALIQGLAEALPGMLSVLWDATVQVVGGLWDYVAGELLGIDYTFDNFTKDINKTAEAAWTEMQKTWNAIGKPVWDLISDTVTDTAGVFAEKMPEMSGFAFQCFEDIGSYWNEHLLPCLQAIGYFIENVLAPVFSTVFNMFIGPAVNATFQYISDLWNNSLMPTLIGITDFLTGVFTGDWQLAFDGLSAINDGFKAGFEAKWNLLTGFLTGVWQEFCAWFASTFPGVVETVSSTVAMISEKWEEIKSHISEKVAEILATVISKFNEIKNEISTKVNDAKSKVEEAFQKIKQAIDEEMAEALGIVGEIWENIKAVFSDAVSVGTKLVDDIRSGIDQAWDSLTSWFKGIWDSAFGNLTASVTVNKQDGVNGSHATGLSYVPFDGYIAELHKGEMVVPAEEASMLRSGNIGGSSNADVVSLLTMILDAVQQGNERETVLKLNNREFGRAVRGVVSV